MELEPAWDSSALGETTHRSSLVYQLLNFLLSRSQARQDIASNTMYLFQTWVIFFFI